jgi:hypothetical protein
MQERSEDSLCAILNQIRKLYFSDNGKNLENGDWAELKHSVEAYDRTVGGEFLSLDKVPSENHLIEPITSLKGKLDSIGTTRARRTGTILVNNFDFVFQVIQHYGTGKGVKGAENDLIDTALKDWQLSLSYDLAPYQDFLNRFRAEGYLSQRYEGELFESLSYDTGSYGYCCFYFDHPVKFPISFHDQRWHLSYGDLKLIAETSMELLEVFERNLYEHAIAGCDKCLRLPLKSVVKKSLNDCREWENRVIWDKDKGFVPFEERNSPSLIHNCSGSLKRNQVAWLDIYRSWKSICENYLHSGIVGKTEILKVETPRYSPYGLCRDHFEWWPKKDLEQYREDECADGIIPGRSRPELLSTAYSLAEYQNDIEKQHAVYILASLWSKEKNLPEAWRGDVYRLLEEMIHATISQHREVYDWHFACTELLPINLLGYPGYRIIVPSDWHDIIYLVALESALNYANWQVIEFVEAKDKKS